MGLLSSDLLDQPVSARPFDIATGLRLRPGWDISLADAAFRLLSRRSARSALPLEHRDIATDSASQ